MDTFNNSETAGGGSKVAMYAVVALIVGALVGGGSGYALAAGNKSNTDTKMDATDTTTDSSMTMTESDGVTVGGAKMIKTLDIVDNAAKAKNVTTVVAAVKAAGLVDTLKSAGPFTVFGPNNDAFEALPAGTVETLLKTENKATLVKILTYHVVSGTFTSADLRVMASKGQTLTTVEGEMLTPMMEGNSLMIKDAKGGMATVETADVISSNGVTHVIDAVLMPAG